MTAKSPTWIKEEMVCKCGAKFKPAYRNGILISKSCPNCMLKSLHKEFKPKGVRFNVKNNSVENSPEKQHKSDKSKWMDKADKIFSRYIRLKFSFQSGGELFCRDIISGRIYQIKSIDNGHCFSRYHKATRFEEDNCRPQNRSSNRFSGEKDHYTFIKNLRAEIGEERFSRIERLKDSTGEDSETFYHLQYDTYKHLFQELLFERGLTDPWKSKR